MCVCYAEVHNNQFIGSEGGELTGENRTGQDDSQPVAPIPKQIN